MQVSSECPFFFHPSLIATLSEPSLEATREGATARTIPEPAPERTPEPPIVSSDSSSSPNEAREEDDLMPLPQRRPSTVAEGAFASPRRLHRPSLEALITTPHVSSNLAVLLPKELWKPDSQSSACDALDCGAKFGLFHERRHHCRKCGGVFCGTCTTHSAALLDTTAMPFIFPPPDHPILNSPVPSLSSSVSSVSTSSSTPTSLGPPVDVHRICDECYWQLRSTRATGTALSPQRSRRSSHDSVGATLGSPLGSTASHSTPGPHNPSRPPSSLRQQAHHHQFAERELRQHASVSSLRSPLPSASHDGSRPHSRPSMRRSHSSQEAAVGFGSYYRSPSSTLLPTAEPSPSSGHRSKSRKSSLVSSLCTEEEGESQSQTQHTDSRTPRLPRTPHESLVYALSPSTLPHTRSSHSHSSARDARRSARAKALADAEKEAALTGAIQSYPLIVSSAACQARGGGIWAPKPVPVDVSRSGVTAAAVQTSRIRLNSGGNKNYMMPHIGDDSYESDDDYDDDDMARNEKKRLWRSRLIIDGDIKVRIPLAPAPVSERRGLALNWSTF
ncbi:hypothetical protein BS47DRAFT_908152 [Hydnum rufescens UP504]|uniref:FYVE-type domain-containing protein n=1 Tax=Hydnum rufescens UP504 TaxID=1448309 RepID=A0A9P6AXK0_9AGAM|nr:hypothetical protein BS47DRAFT_908152 [Hydnum rufescens UP504]